MSDKPSKIDKLLPPGAYFKKRWFQYLRTLILIITGFLLAVLSITAGGLLVIVDLTTGLILFAVAAIILAVSIWYSILFAKVWKAFQEVKALYNHKQVADLIQIIDWANIEKIYDIARTMLSLYALVDLGAPELVPILAELYYQESESPERQQAYIEPLEVLARKLNYISHKELLADPKYQFDEELDESTTKEEEKDQ
ncbi:MAG: hypothetical protein FK734_09345 [Asgard group archaeon]|nr:hypothetical protein [Asgard group archaeon]